MEAASIALAKSEARLRLITDAVPAAMAYVDRDLVVRFANRRFAALFRKNADRVVGRTMLQLLGNKLLGSIEENIAAAMHGASQTFEHAYALPEGGAIVARTELVPEFGQDGAVVGLFVLSIDVTEEKRSERAVREAQKMSAIGQLAGGLAHDFNNLLTVIVGNLASLRERADGADVAEYLDPTIRASYRGVEIVRRLLAFARQQPLEPVAIDAAQLVADSAQLLRRSLPGNIRVQCVADGATWPALADAAQLESAVINLALNARDAMPSGGTLTLRTACARLEDGHACGSLAAGDYVSIEVEDEGCGIPADAIERIFEPFYTSKPFGLGSGLGLSMVLGFARQSGGDVRVKSEVGRGTSVSILLPRARAGREPARTMPPEAAKEAVGQGRLVLLVEDDEDVRRTVRRHLLDLGFQVLEACDADDARSLLSSVSGVAVLVSDVVMPGKGGDGLGLADEARRLVPGIKVVLMSGFTSWSAGGYDWYDESLLLRKPFGREDLTRALSASP
jgi:PAS domain S-box-containing protein